jgi:hypothetical protein
MGPAVAGPFFLRWVVCLLFAVVVRTGWNRGTINPEGYLKGRDSSLRSEGEARRPSH